jgi:acetyltransferase
MTVRNLEFLFRPASIAVIAEPGEASGYAEVVRKNLTAGGFAGPIAFVATRRGSRLGIGPRVRLERMEFVPDLAIICARFHHIPEIVSQLGALGVRA